jgi:hypothetical protein
MATAETNGNSLWLHGQHQHQRKHEQEQQRQSNRLQRQCQLKQIKRVDTYGALAPPATQILLL